MQNPYEKCSKLLIFLLFSQTANKNEGMRISVQFVDPWLLFIGVDGTSKIKPVSGKLAENE